MSTDEDRAAREKRLGIVRFRHPDTGAEMTASAALAEKILGGRMKREDVLGRRVAPLTKEQALEQMKETK